MAVKKFRVDSFVTDVKNHIEASENALSWLMNAYLWAGEHLKEIHRRWPDYTQEWLVSEIQRVYNINPVVYARTLRTLGNGTDNAATQRGFNAMNKFGVWECTRADRLLDRESVQQLATEIEIIPDAEVVRFSLNRRERITRGLQSIVHRSRRPFSFAERAGRNGKRKGDRNDDRGTSRRRMVAGLDG